MLLWDTTLGFKLCTGTDSQRHCVCMHVRVKQFNRAHLRYHSLETLLHGDQHTTSVITVITFRKAIVLQHYMQEMVQLPHLQLSDKS